MVAGVSTRRFQLVYYFFFQAEDGIRDLTVTGVQTCALPISLTKTARQWTAGQPAPNTTAVALNTSAKPETTRENIGSDSIEGLPVRGVRVTQDRKSVV